MTGLYALHPAGVDPGSGPGEPDSSGGGGVTRTDEIQEQCNWGTCSILQVTVQTFGAFW